MFLSLSLFMKSETIVTKEFHKKADQHKSSFVFFVSSCFLLSGGKPDFRIIF